MAATFVARLADPKGSTSGDGARMAEPFAGLGALDDLPVIQHEQAVDDHVRDAGGRIASICSGVAGR